VDIAYDWMRVAMAVTGTLSIYLGYRLFCGISYRNTLTNLVAGALLAIFGLGFLIADVRSIAAGPDSPSASQRRKSTEEGSFQTPKFNKHIKVAEHLI